jgi:hypothetical protein
MKYAVNQERIMKKFQALSLLLLSIFVISCSSTKNASDSKPIPTVLPDFSKIDSYESLLARAKKMDTTVSFYDLRMAYTRTAEYVPFTSDGQSEAKEAFNLLNKGEIEEAKAKIDEAIELHFLSILSHMLANNICEQLDDDVGAMFHSYILQGMVSSITNSGDGKPQIQHT